MDVFNAHSVHSYSHTGRYMSYLSSIGAIDEAGKEEYVANKVTRNLATRVAEAGISHW
jgi:hypothetical protein